VATNGATAYIDDVGFVRDNQLVNPGFEIDANHDGRPDNWFSLSRFVLSGQVVYSGVYSGMAFATAPTNLAPGDRVDYVQAGTTYYFSIWVNVPSASSAFTLRPRIRWFDVNNQVLAVQSLPQSITSTTPGWVQLSGPFVTPTNAFAANVEIPITNLNTNLYLDQAFFGPA
jgi:hypothetical protein